MPIHMTRRIERLPRRKDALMVPRPVSSQPGLVMVDVTWGTISPMQLFPGVRTVGELEVIQHIDEGLPLIDTRLEHFYRDSTIPGARNINHKQAGESLGSLDPQRATVFFCNVFEVPPTLDRFLALPHEVFDTPEDIVRRLTA